MKALQINSVKVIFSKNELIDCGFFTDFKLRVIFPGCRKSVSTSYSPSAGSIWVRPLYGYNGVAHVSLEDWRRIFENAIFEDSALEYAQVGGVTDGHIAEATSLHCSRVIESASQQLADLTSGFKPTFDEVIFDL